MEQNGVFSIKIESMLFLTIMNGLSADNHVPTATYSTFVAMCILNNPQQLMNFV